jgi:hypothetical protein
VLLVLGCMGELSAVCVLQGISVELLLLASAYSAAVSASSSGADGDGALDASGVAAGLRGAPGACCSGGVAGGAGGRGYRGARWPTSNRTSTGLQAAGQPHSMSTPPTQQC